MSESAKALADPPATDRDPHAHAHANGHLHDHQFETLEQQHESGILGMWAFLATEVMFFGGLFAGFYVYRFTNPGSFALACRGLDITMGCVNTCVLLTSSLAMALAVRAGQTNDKKGQVRWLAATMALGTLFLVFKGFEYYHEFEKGLIPGPGFNIAALGSVPDDATPFFLRRTQLFFVFYFFMTGLHAFHMVIGIALMAVLLYMARKGAFTAEKHMGLELTGLYWHFVDIVWVFLYPSLYLIDLHK